MNILKLVKTGLLRSGRFLKKHAPTILTVFGAGGAVTSVVLAVKATPKAMILIEERKKREQKERLTPLETVDACWKVYVPTAGTLVTAVACVIGANVLNLKTQAALLGLYSAQGELMKTYKDKVIEAIGPEEETKIKNEAVREQLKDDPRVTGFIPIHPGEFPVHDELTGQIFSSTRQTVELHIAEAKNLIYETPFNELTQNEWLMNLGARPVKFGDEWAWNSDTGFYAEVETLEINNTPCYSIRYEANPVKRFS
jgi:hypothetical protein